MEEEVLMRTLYYVKAGANWFAFYLNQGALALANGGARFTSFGAVLAWAGRARFRFRCELRARRIRSRRD
jgi:hypothetical protein